MDNMGVESDACPCFGGMHVMALSLRCFMRPVYLGNNVIGLLLGTLILGIGKVPGSEVQIKDAAADEFAKAVSLVMSTHGDENVKWTAPFTLIYTGERDGHYRTKPIPGDMVVSFRDSTGERGYVIVSQIIGRVPGEPRLEALVKALPQNGGVVLRDAVHLGRTPFQP